MQPKVTLYIAMSLDGRINGFKINQNVYKHIKSHLSTDALVMDFDTFIIRHDIFEGTSDNSKQLMVVSDSRGDIPYKILIEVSKSMKVLVLCTRSTPPDYLNFLEENFINYMIVGYDEVNMATAFEELNIHFGVRNIAVHADGVLNGKLIADDLVEELSVFIHPTVVGANNDLMYIPDINENQNLDLRLIEMKEMENEIIYLKYRIMKYKF
jgi:2,5-diamino-6-(ribosylamino)-4(3H)-pyrimidinone 5'-phosphate reductase